MASEFFVLRRESGTVRSDLPAWTSRSNDPFQLLLQKDKGACNDPSSDGDMPQDVDTCESPMNPSSPVEYRPIKDIPGTFQLLDVLTKEECQAMVGTFEELGFTDDAAVSLPKRIRHNTNLVWIADNATLEALWERRIKDQFVQPLPDQFLGRKPMGLNGRFRVYRYGENDYFKYHTDGSWPGTRVVQTQSDTHHEESSYELLQNAFPGHAWSLYSIVAVSNGRF